MAPWLCRTEAATVRERKGDLAQQVKSRASEYPILNYRPDRHHVAQIFFVCHFPPAAVANH